MFGWFKPHCPVDPAAKKWVEEKLQWLGDEFGFDVFIRRAVVTPTEDFFPDAFDGSELAVRTLLDRVCAYMDADPDRVELKLFTERNQLGLVNDQGHAIAGVAGLYEGGAYQCTIRIETTELGDPLGLVGTMAHELAHLRLLGEGRYHVRKFDNELLTDLTVVFHGMGVFLANSPRVWVSQFTQWPGTTLRKPEYMTPPMFGYAMGHRAWLCGETKPAWGKHLNWAARANLKETLRYLNKTEDSMLRDRRRKPLV